MGRLINIETSVPVMATINLKQEDLEQVLIKTNVSPELEAVLRAEIQYYDEYYLIVPQQKIVKAFRQEFVKDPHIGLSSIPEIRLVNYDEGTPFSALEEIFALANLPIITRDQEKATLSGFRPIYNRDGAETWLVAVAVPIPRVALNHFNPHVRPMAEENLRFISELFRKEYSLRYRLVETLWRACPPACFVYEQKGQIEGVSFNAVTGDELSMRQLFVREGRRGRGIGKALYETRLEFARQSGLARAKAAVRWESLQFHQLFGAKKEDVIQKYVIRNFPPKSY